MEQTQTEPRNQEIVAAGLAAARSAEEHDLAGTPPRAISAQADDRGPRVHAVRCPECNSHCLTLKETTGVGQIILPLTGRQHYQCGGCRKSFDARDRRTGVRRTASLFLFSAALAFTATLYFHAKVLGEFGKAAQTELQADLTSMKDDWRLGKLETRTIRDEMGRLWEDAQYQAGKLKTSLGAEPASDGSSATQTK
jgi:hypothetical protein